VIDDDIDGRETLCEALEEDGYNVLGAATGRQGLDMLKDNSVDLVITDLKMPDIDGLEVLKRARQVDPAVTVLLITAYATVDTAIAAIRQGAYDYVTKPIDLRRLRPLLQRALSARALELELHDLKRRLDDKYGMESIIGRSAPMKQVFERVHQVAPTRSVVLITGESGTGKELVANAVHNLSPRRDKPFVKVNCAAIPETLLESELFGHEKGSFTGAHEQRKGRFELADGGSLLLDEVSEMSLTTQVKLLRVLQEFEFERVGGTQTLKVDVRVLASTNADLDQLVERGRFRQDLLYRLKVVPIHLPPLRERPEDIPLLVKEFLRRYAEQDQKDVKEISPGAIQVLMRYPWPGNIRELQNVVENMVISSTRPALDIDDVPLEIRSAAPVAAQPVFPVGLSMRELEERAIRETLASVEGNRREAAGILGIGLRTLHRKIQEYGLERIRKHRTDQKDRNNG
jgi:DNA-binding NtrC family response regulator